MDALTGGQVPGLALLEGLEGAAEGGGHLGLGPQALTGNQIGPAGMGCREIWRCGAGQAGQRERGDNLA